MRTRLRGPGGASTITLADDATIGDLIAHITEKTSITSFDVKYGYPPKPLLLQQSEKSLPLSKLDVKLDGEQLTISARDDPSATTGVTKGQSAGQKHDEATGPNKAQTTTTTKASESFSFAGIPPISQSEKKPAGPVSLQRKSMEGDVPEIPLPDRGATLVLRVMPDDNSCLFRAFAQAVLPTGDDKNMPELRQLITEHIHDEPEKYTKVVLEQEPAKYCEWIKTNDAWGGAIELGILSEHFEIEICSIDVQSLRVDKYNEGKPTRCILVYSGIHYDTIVQSPSDYPHTKAHNPPDFDIRVWDIDDDTILFKALDLCRILKERHYYTDTGGMAIRCNECGAISYGEAQASGHASQTGHYDMAEVPT